MQTYAQLRITIDMPLHLYKIIQMEVYTEAGGKPQTWNRKQQVVASVQQETARGATWLSSFDWENLSKPVLAGYLLLTFAASLLIPRMFLGYHNKLVGREISPGFRSLYWGSAAISLFLVSIIMLGKISLVCILIRSTMPYTTAWLDTLLVVELLMPIVFFVASVIASRNSKTVPMPAIKFTTHVLFCCCCCFCCSSQRKSKGVQVLTLWAFMTFIYYHIMEAIALVFALFINIPLTISYALIYASGLFFAIMLVSVILFSCQSTDVPRSTPAKCLGAVDVFAILFSSSFVIFIFVAFITISLTHSDVKGFEAVSLKFSLLPSIALSVAGWLIRAKLLKEDSPSNRLL